ncbi:hypothetical protein IFO70_31865 [Phormidium tenue FACHB-886]|nr:hypothetical protein [Phormidium tenue FACHB-886]
MNSKWLGLALLTYLIGAVIEGVSAASALVQAAPNLEQDVDNPASSPTRPPVTRWRLVVAITTVSICGAFSWPCRLVHRSLKATQNGLEKED